MVDRKMEATRERRCVSYGVKIPNSLVVTSSALLLQFPYPSRSCQVQFWGNVLAGFRMATASMSKIPEISIVDIFLTKYQFLLSSLYVMKRKKTGCGPSTKVASPFFQDAIALRTLKFGQVPRRFGF